MSEWRLAKSLVTLRRQVNVLAPERSKASDGTVSSAAHRTQNPNSDHDPDAQGIVRALDITHDPAHGLDSYALADQILAAQDPRLKYVISNRRIGSGPAGPKPGKWRRYTGVSPHDHHVHVSVVDDGRADDTRPWDLGPAVRPAAVKPAPIAQEDDVIVLVIDSVKECWLIWPGPRLKRRVRGAEREVLMASPLAMRRRSLDQAALTLLAGYKEAK